VLRNARTKGPAGARNTGILAATGKFIAFLDSDDAFLPGHLDACQRVFEKHPDVDAVFGRALYEQDGQAVDYMGPNFDWKLAEAPKVRTDGEVIVFGDGFFTHLLTQGCYFNLSTVALRANASRQLMREELRIAEDFEYWVRLSRTHRFACLDRPQIRYALHDANISFEADASAASTAPQLLTAYRIIAAYPGLDEKQKQVLRQRMAEVLFDWAYRSRMHRDLGGALRLHFQALRLGKRRQNALGVLKALATAALPRRSKQVP
jgi:glycosyltransferase involved in cell wall biosynthesis